MSLVRKAKAQDLERVIELTALGLIEIGENYEESCVVNNVVSSYHTAPCFLLEIDDIIRGIAGLTSKSSSWSGDVTLYDYMFYIEPEYRNLDNLGGLVEKSKEFASSVGLPLRLQFIVNDDLKVRERMLKMHGLKPSLLSGDFYG